MSESPECPDVPERFRLLFVCTGNTCRSPMAEALARRMLDEREWPHVEVGSAGTAATPGQPASGGALRAAQRHGLDLTGHESRPVTPDLLDWADLVLCMSPGHVWTARELGGADRVALLGAFAEDDPEGGAAVPDPFGGPDAFYEETYEALERLVARSLSRLEPIISP